ncbi:MAG: hypothetical protein AAB257_00450 [Nitrospinota bacterium]
MKGETKMDFRKLSAYIYWLGTVIAVLGAIKGTAGSWEWAVRGDALTTVAVGVIVAFIGFAIGAFAKKNKN